VTYSCSVSSQAQGSGKTLAYSLPILSYLLRTPLSRSTRRPLSGLVLCPTRELALQVVDHLNKFVKHTAEDEEKKGPPRISIGSVVGGLSAQKQKRIVDRGCDILVATPGRLWDLIKTVRLASFHRRGADGRMSNLRLVSGSSSSSLSTKRTG
jgi:superfamily II DNA/RNA helicase